MEHKILKAFDTISADEKLKENTLKSIEKQKLSKKVPSMTRRLAAVMVSFCILIFAGGFSFHIYSTPDAYVDIDVNPSIELTLNRFNRVIRTHAYNDDGERILSGIHLWNQTSEKALTALIAAMQQEGYLDNRSLLSITVQSGSNSQLLEAIHTYISCTVEDHHITDMEQDIYSIDIETKKLAQELNLSPAQYLAIRDLQEIDPAITFEECKNNSIRELREYKSAHTPQHQSQHKEHHPIHDSCVP